MGMPAQNVGSGLTRDPILSFSFRHFDILAKMWPDQRLDPPKGWVLPNKKSSLHH